MLQLEGITNKNDIQIVLCSGGAHIEQSFVFLVGEGTFIDIHKDDDIGFQSLEFTCGREENTVFHP